MTTKLTSLIAKSFWAAYHDIKQAKHKQYWFKGGRGSTKSSFISIAIIRLMMTDPSAHAAVVRKVGNTLRDSVFAQLKWAIGKLGVSAYWHCTTSPMRMTYLPTGQTILFRGLDDPDKAKSLKVDFGYFKFLWFEELTDFDSEAELRNARQSVIRGGEGAITLCSYNPPKNANNWVNVEVEIPNELRLVHHSTYLSVPPEWLGADFLAEAEHLKKSKPEAYRHEYLGEVIGTGGQIFRNVILRKITDDEIRTFDNNNIRRGIDWGFASDPLHYGEKHYDRMRRRLHIYFEIHKVGLKNSQAAELIKRQNKSNGVIICDSAEPKSIADMKDYGLNVKGAKKGPDSVEYGIKFLQDLDEIIIDPERCPETAREFRTYELEPDKLGGFKARFPDRNNHSIDEARYSLEDDMKYVGGMTTVKH